MEQNIDYNYIRSNLDTYISDMPLVYAEFYDGWCFLGTYTEYINNIEHEISRRLFTYRWSF